MYINNLCFQAKDADKVTELEYSIIEGNEGNLFAVDSHTGEITVVDPMGLDMSNVSTDYIHLIIQVCKKKLFL